MLTLEMGWEIGIIIVFTQWKKWLKCLIRGSVMLEVLLVLEQ